MNQPPQTEKQTGPRIASKGAYAARSAKKAVLTSGGGILYVLGLAGFALLLALLVFVRPSFEHPDEISIFVMIAVVATGYVYIGRRTLHKGIELDTGVPLTRANPADLPAADTLVRGSAEPRQEQEVRHEVASTIVWLRPKR